MQISFFRSRNDAVGLSANTELDRTFGHARPTLASSARHGNEQLRLSRRPAREPNHPEATRKFSTSRDRAPKPANSRAERAKDIHVPWRDARLRECVGRKSRS